MSRKYEDEDVDVKDIALRNYFQNKIIDKEPTLIVKQKVGKIDAYSRLCQSNQRRQPVILTPDEMERIRNKYPSYNDPKNYIQYGTNPEDPYYYICPKYWDLKKQEPISEEVMNEKKLKKFIIPRDAKKVPANAYIYEFTNDKGVYYPYPNFIPDRHPDGHYLPCCFQDYDTAKRVKVREEVDRKQQELLQRVQKKGSPINSSDMKMKPPTPPLSPDDKEESIHAKDYIKGPEKFPLDPGRWGHLPIGLQKLLEHDNTSCQLSKTNMNLKNDHPCLLRYGVRQTSKSFLECIASIEGFSTLEEFMEVLYEQIDLDFFMVAKNGNLIEEFYDPKVHPTEEEMARYKNSKFHKKITTKKMNNLKKKGEDLSEMFYKVCVSYTSFMRFLMSQTSYVDHTHLWDIVSNIFNLRLCIFEIPEDDITDNVEVLCPSNSYSRELLSSTEDKMAMIVKKGNYFEPIYLYEKHKIAEPTIKRVFSSKDAYFKSVIKILKRIFEFLQKECKPKSLLRVEESPSIYTLLDLLKEPKYSVMAQVVNYSAKTIGVIAQNKDGFHGFIPCHPTGILYQDFKDRKYEIPKGVEFFNDLKIYTPYYETLYFYQELCKNTRKKIPCKLAFKLVEDNNVIGFLTTTDQLVMISEPIPLEETDDDIPVLNPMLPVPNVKVDKELLMSVNIKDDERERYVNEIKHDSLQYFIFRNIIKLLLKNTPENKAAVVEAIIDKDKEALLELLQITSEHKIEFVDKSAIPLHLVPLKTDDVIYLTNGKAKNNRTKYYEKITDELMRNTRLRRYMLDNSLPIIVNKDDYDVNKDELMFNESSIMDYYDNMSGKQQRRQVNIYNSYDTADPYNYDELVEKDDYKFYKDAPHIGKQEQDCNETEHHITTKRLKQIFAPERNRMVQFDCPYGIFNAMMPNVSIDEIRETLIEQYTNLSEYIKKIYAVLKEQGKRKLIEEIVSKKMDIKNIILSKNYYLTTLDIWILCLKYEIPCILVSLRDDIRSNLIETMHHDKYALLYGTPVDLFYFIGVPSTSVKSGSLFLFKHSITDEERDSGVNPYKYSIAQLSNPALVEKCFAESINIRDFLAYYTSQKITLKRKKQVANESEEEEEEESDED